MKHTSFLAVLVAGGLAGAPSFAHAATCTTDTPVDAGIISDASSTIGGGGTYHATGTATCPDQPGPKGDKGDKGDTGEQGPQGVAGADGATGPQGPKGDKGDKGDMGAQGVQGVAGAQGPKGDKGDTGAAGATGAKGDKGDKGDTGAHGIAGKDGKDFDPGDMHEGLATVAALNVPHVEKNFAASLSGGFYDDRTALGVGVGVRFDQTWQFGGSVAIGTNGGDVAGKAVLTGQW